MRGGLGSLFRRRRRGEAHGRLELVVVEGSHRGARFPLEPPEMRIGRGTAARSAPGAIVLDDPSVSSQQAILEIRARRTVIRHVPKATNATRVNDERITEHVLVPGDRITCGRTVLEVREAAAAEPAGVRAATPAPPQASSSPVQAGSEAAGQLVLTAGIPGLDGTRFPFQRRRTTIGRSDKCDITVKHPTISRRHAALVFEGERLVVVHESLANSTRVNGVEVADRHTLSYGDELKLADRVTFTVLLGGTGVEASAPGASAPAPISEDVAAATRVVSEPTTDGSGEVTLLGASPTEGASATQIADGTQTALAANRRPVHTPTPSPVSYDGPEELAIIGSGPAGIAAACQAARAKVRHTLYERGELASTVQSYHKGKWVMDEPQALALQPGLSVGFEAGSREEVLDRWQSAVAEAGVNLRAGTAGEVVRIEGRAGDFTLTLKDGATAHATHVILAIGVQGNPRVFDAPGADAEWVTYQLADPAAHAGKRVVVVGVGDAGIENALALVDQGCEVLIVNRREEFARAKSRNRGMIERAISAGQVVHYQNARVDRFEDHVVVLRTNDGEVRVQADLVIGRLGATAPRAFLEEIGIEFPSEDSTAVPELTERYETNVAGVHVVGALAGHPLIKNCMNQGYEVVEHILGHEVVPADEPILIEKLSALPGTVREVLERIREVVPLLAGLTAIQLREFLFDSEVRRLPAGTTVFERNDFSDSFYVILEGAVRAIFPAHEADAASELDEEERQQREYVLAAGSFFGESSLISGRRRSATARVVEDAVLIETPRLAMLSLTRSVADVRRVIDEAFVGVTLRDLIPDVSAEARAGLAASAVVLAFKPGDTIFAEGDEPDGLHIIRRGTVTVSQKRDGLDSVIQYCQAGSIIGEVALLGEGRLRSTSVRPTVFTETVLLPKAAVLAFMEEHPAMRRMFEKAERTYAIADAARGAEQRPRGTMMFVLQEGGHEATDLLLIDESLCIRCDNCEKACASTHGGVSRLDREAGPTYATSGGSQLHIPTACQHCENPKCMDDCPPDALRRDPNGEIFIMDNCIGCGNCETNCPYGVIKMSALDDDPGPGLLFRLLFGTRAKKQSAPPPDEGEAPAKKLAVKCDLCRALPPMRDGSARAACVASCPTGAIVRVDPRHYVDELLDARS